MTISINEKTEKTVITCNTCGKETFSVEGVRSNRKAYAKAIETGWRWKDAATQIGPKCRETAKKAASNGNEKKVAPSGEGKKLVTASKPTSKKAQPTHKPVTLFGKKKAPISSAPVNVGQSIGKLARSAKVEAAPAAE